MIKILIIGSGTMGRSLTELFLQNDVSVFLYDKNKEVLRDTENYIKQKNFKNKNFNILKNIPVYLNVNIIIETVSEVLNIKKEVIENIEKYVPKETIICSNTSGLPLSEIGKNMNIPERFIGMHFYTPSTIIPLVEVIKSQFTSERTAKTTYDFLVKVGKKPVLLKREIPGFIGNRIQHVIMREALFLLEKEVASIEDIDEIIKWSVGVRLAINGPFEQRDINGIDTHLNIANYLYETLNNCESPSYILQEKLENKHLGIKTLRGFYDWSEQDLKAYYKYKDEKLTDILELLK
ncbi:3-hydroxyacyl-CoA dehydrogenase NAD-binding domain-containing protein [Salinicoccus sp. YB14-2]|uniref:3-hydroxyacyl-CoA dehydrogenase NAD-binding domain-containing protein n=1 Tax=Salinicoccus sp. YB14-2 TaxID=1572701 RepID=UPI00068ACEF4|nr:3-hydroxyacyl-CoA dehydrogenase NAD-binding domain-containing protein [Salinicoccus sp. YB14-2]